VTTDNFDDDVGRLAIIIKNDPSAQQSIVYLDIDIGMRPWFTRAWVLQRAAVSKDLTLKCGSDEISWEEFARFHDLLGTALGMSLFSLPTSLQELDRVSDITSIREALTEGVTVPLSHLVAWNRWAYATDPGDLVFSLLNLSTDSQDSVLQPDYSASNKPVDVFRQLVEHSVSQQTLDIICVSRGTPKLGWPSGHLGSPTGMPTIFKE
jgi:hypothetical protein